MEKYVPDIYQKSIFVINYTKLYNRGIRLLMFDLDNTLITSHEKEIPKKVQNLFKKVKKIGFKVIIFSNSLPYRVKMFGKELDVDCYANSMKPLKKNFLKIIDNYTFEINEIAIIGDQILTDVLGGNKVGITTVLVNPISEKDFTLTKINRIVEKVVMKKLKDNDLFFKGRYYD